MLFGANLSLGNQSIDRMPAHVFSIAGAQRERAAAAVSTPGSIDGKRAQQLLNGDGIFAAMRHGIAAAERSVTPETKIHFFSDAMRKQAAAGVRAHVLLDWIGGEPDDALLQTMRNSGV